MSSYLSKIPLPFSSAADSPRIPEQDGLQRHVYQCDRANGVWHRAQCAAEAVDSFMSVRFVSTVVVATGFLAFSAYW